MALFKTSILDSGRVHPKTKPISKRTTVLSLLDATVTDFAKTSATWLFECPEQAGQFNLPDHLRQSLQITLNAYPQWCGQLKSINSLSHSSVPERSYLPPHARRFGRVYVTYGSREDPGVEFIIGNSTATIEDLIPLSRTKDKPIWDRHEAPIDEFSPLTSLVNPLKDNPEDEYTLPAIAIQATTLACGGYVLSVKAAHAIADAHSLIYFVKHWAAISRSILRNLPLPSPTPIFNPEMLDSLAAGDISSDAADQTIIQQTNRLPFHRYDWWIPSPSMPSWGTSKPDVFAEEEVVPAGNAIPWCEFDMEAPISHYVVHLTKEQIEFLWREANKGSSERENKERITRHDAILAHIWSCINRARQMDQDDGPVHADLSYGLRPVLNLGEDFMGSPIVILNIEMRASELTSTTATDRSKQAINIQPIAQHIRKTINQANDPSLLAAHLHNVAFEKTPQRIWQAFLGRRHILVTTWARAGLYEVDFGFGGESKVRYAWGIVPDMDGIVLIKEAGALDRGMSWTERGVDVSIRLRREDMERLLRDPLLLPDI
ncbi:transferase family [Aspergillus sclerotialis]|uniref:Transferase family n=1 Tax=Aspergillus sclerotialis TaxID=2070753 RepID=A0A3A3AAF9_9EURO|nr:transferase family [Aspergillus sclerotialis]